MAISLSKPTSSSGISYIQGSTPASLPASNGAELLRQLVAHTVFDDYCDSQAFSQLVASGIKNFQLDQKTSEIIIAMELENKGIVNETALLGELKELLHRFTDSDKKLDPKERDDALQFVCKTRHGFTRGLSYEVANQYLLDFCRMHRVKIKTGFMKWQIP